jgi:hypothetical protein
LEDGDLFFGVKVHFRRTAALMEEGFQVVGLNACRDGHFALRARPKFDDGTHQKGHISGGRTDDEVADRSVTGSVGGFVQ